MYGVCKKYLETHQEQRERLYEVEAPGNWSQRRNVWLSILVQHQPTHNASSHITRATDKRLIGNKGKKSMPRLTGTEPRCVEKQLTDRAETPQKCKKAKIS
ncbi:hypothetical protein AMELA_G00038190 [Ameiurus melas]|uniref:Uncharacterized protein n=1 Tax=Ameiurus melas TaxID=219545 RepID=A0A7J6BBV7_AMEME|nr:hypothetical protein AMELA_G00038190 [Ameiurus melas]